MRSLIRRSLTSAALSLVGAGLLTSQEPPGQVFRAETALMEVEVKVARPSAKVRTRTGYAAQ